MSHDCEICKQPHTHSYKTFVKEKVKDSTGKIDDKFVIKYFCSCQCMEDWNCPKKVK